MTLLDSIAATSATKCVQSTQSEDESCLVVVDGGYRVWLNESIRME